MATHRFYRHRIFRIFPAYWFALTVIVIWFGIKFDSLWQGVSFYALLQDYGSGPVFDPKFQPIYQAWSLATELAFYALLPLFVWAMRRSLRRFQLDAQVRLLLVVCGVLYAAGALLPALSRRRRPHVGEECGALVSGLARHVRTRHGPCRRECVDRLHRTRTGNR